MKVTVCFYSYLKDVTGCSRIIEELPERSTLEALWDKLSQQFPKLKSMKQSVLMAVGVDYQQGGYELKEDDEVSLFPPVQGG